MAKKRKIKKKPVLILLFIIFLSCFGLYKLINNSDKLRLQLASLGYDDDEINLIMDKVPSSSYDLFKDYDESIIDLVSSKDYNSKLFSKYYEYYSKNKKSEIKNIKLVEKESLSEKAFIIVIGMVIISSFLSLSSVNSSFLSLFSSTFISILSSSESESLSE